jgi:cytochrome c-type biogenesis protein CcmH/NrfF
MTQNLVIWVFFVAVGIIGFVQIFKINRIASKKRRNKASSLSNEEQKQLRNAWTIIIIAMIAFLVLAVVSFLVRIFQQ